jgi:hypothetical protein
LPKRGKERENFAKEGNSFLLMFPLHPIPLSLYHSRNKEPIHLISGGEGFEILILDKGMEFFWEDLIHSIQLEFWISPQKLFHHILVLLMEDGAGAVNEDASLCYINGEISQY